jgi:hypothetical protein
VVTFPQQSLLTTTDNLWNRETPTVFVEDHPRHNYHPSTGEITFGSGKKTKIHCKRLFSIYYFKFMMPNFTDG